MTTSDPANDSAPQNLQQALNTLTDYLDKYTINSIVTDPGSVSEVDIEVVFETMQLDSSISCEGGLIKPFGLLPPYLQSIVASNMHAGSLLEGATKAFGYVLGALPSDQITSLQIQEAGDVLDKCYSTINNRIKLFWGIVSDMCPFDGRRVLTRSRQVFGIPVQGTKSNALVLLSGSLLSVPEKSQPGAADSLLN